MRTTTAIEGRIYTEAELLPALIGDALREGNSVTVWRLPNSSEKHVLICTEGVRPVDEISLEDSLAGFIVAPFSRGDKKMFFRANVVVTFDKAIAVAETVPERYTRKEVMFEEMETEQSIQYPVRKASSVTGADFQATVRSAIEAVKSGELEKVVPSRMIEVPRNAGFDLIQGFNKLCDAYPHAMVSLIMSEETGTWMGATPELLVSRNESGIFKTVALAGTQRFNPELPLSAVTWNEKEIEEQALVCRYIISCFKRIRVREYDEQGPRTSKAGNVVHLKTDFKIDTVAINYPQLASVMLDLLHPTSAVCGMPLELAREFLREHEGYDREYYAGYLGPVNFRDESHIYVNIRCLQLLEDKIRLYAGAGVTIDSVPEKEWQETAMKFETLLSTLNA